MRKFAIWAFATMLLVSGAASAQSFAASCNTYFASDANLPADVTAFFADMRKRAVEKHIAAPILAETALGKCVWNGRASYTLVSPVQHGAGVCRFTNMDVSEMFSPDQTYLPGKSDEPANENRSPYEKMTLASPDGACPDQADKGYLPVLNVSPGVFRAILTAWGKIRVSPDEIRAYAALKNDDARSEDILTRLVEALKTHPESLRACALDLSDLVGYKAYAAYSLSICKPGAVVHIDFDLTEAGMRSVAVYETVA